MRTRAAQAVKRGKGGGATNKELLELGGQVVSQCRDVEVPNDEDEDHGGQAGWMEVRSRLRLSCARHGCVIACLNSGLWVATEAGGGLARPPPQLQAGGHSNERDDAMHNDRLEC